MSTATTVWDASRFIACKVVGGSSNDASKRRISYPLWEKGWKGFIKDEVFPLLGLGFTRISVHNPAGAMLSEEMQADQFIHAKETGCGWVEDGFVEYWRKITGSGVEVAMYLGMLKNDPNFVSLAAGRLTKDDWLKRVYESYALVLDAGCSVCFDALFDVREDTPEFRFFQLINSLGVKTYLEPIPHKDNPYMYKANFIITEQLYKHKDASWAADELVLTGEKIRLLNQPYDPTDIGWKNEAAWLPQWINDCRSKNYSCLLGPGGMLERRQTVADLLKIPYKPIVI